METIPKMSGVGFHFWLLLTSLGTFQCEKSVKYIFFDIMIKI